MFRDTYFTFDGVSSEMMEVIACRIDTGMAERQYGLNRSIITEKNINNPLTYDFGYETERLKGELTIMRYSCNDSNNHSLDAKKLSHLSRWLYQDDFKPLISNENPDIVYYVKFTDQHQIAAGADSNGYITLSFECNAPWAWTKPYQKEFDLRVRKNDTPLSCFEFDLKGMGNCEIYNGLEMEFELSTTQYGGKTVSPVSVCNTRSTRYEDRFEINNVYLNNEIIKKYELKNEENIYVHMGKHEVRSDNDGIPSRILNCNKKWIRLEHGVNRIRVEGACFLRIRCQYPALI